jgi:hypothetical protein
MISLQFQKSVRMHIPESGWVLNIFFVGVKDEYIQVTRFSFPVVGMNQTLFTSNSAVQNTITLAFVASE